MFLNKFNKRNDANVYNIVSHDCKKSIPIIYKDGYVVLPHYLSADYSAILKIVDHCENYLTLLRYFDLKEVSEFIHYVVIRNKYASIKMNFTIKFRKMFFYHFHLQI